MRFRPLATLAALASAILALTTAAPQAEAFGDVCYGDVTVKGGVRPTMRTARQSAIDTWEGAVSRKHGRRAADWYYSADRVFDCSWDASGTRIMCVARAIPCAPRAR